MTVIPAEQWMDFRLTWTVHIRPLIERRLSGDLRGYIVGSRIGDDYWTVDTRGLVNLFGEKQ